MNGTGAAVAGLESGFAAEVREGLTRPGQKELPSKYLYDALGSRLFDAITELPEYGVTRAEERLLGTCADDVVGRLRIPVLVSELGSGSGAKTRRLLELLCRRQRTDYYPIEISACALASCRREMSDLRSVRVMGLECEYLAGLAEVSDARKPGEQLVILFLGSTIGNFDRPAAVTFLRRLRGMMAPGDMLLLATDLVKPVAQLVAAYDDSLGVTAAFNLNILARINRELEADFRLSDFRHLACYNEEHRRIEMHLESQRRQHVRIRGADLAVTFEKGETIWTESSHKFEPDEVSAMGAAAGFRCEGQWIEEEWRFAESLLAAQ